VALKRRLRLSWLSFLIFEYHPFKRSILAPLFWATTLFVGSSAPLSLSGQLAFVWSRPILVAYAGSLCALTVAHYIFHNYSILFRELRYALQPGQVEELREIKGEAYRSINNNKISLGMFLV
jgi:hypothetical protein